MRTIIFITLSIQITFAYHDPDLNYHLSQIQKVSNCDDGYSYNAPAVQLTTSGVKIAAAPSFASQHIVQGPSYQYSGQVGYSSGVRYLSEAPKITYAAQPITTYRTSSSGSNYVSGQEYTSKEVHGYATSAGLSSAASNSRTPPATYAQAPIIAKVTAAPLFAKFTISPHKTIYQGQNYIQQGGYFGSSAKESLNYNAVHTGGTVVSQVFPAPSAGYAISDALKTQQPQYITPNQYSSQSAPTVAQYLEAAKLATYSASSNSQGSSVSSQYYTPAISQHFGGSTSHYSAPITTQYTRPAVKKYTSVLPVVQYSPPVIVHHSAPVLTKYPVPTGASLHHHTPVSVSHVPSKNVHKDFIENYDAHPRYAFEYNVNDPHTGDIKHQKEERDGEVVKGQYSLVEPDGSVRTVNYVADWETGFHADVQHSKKQ